MEFLHLDIRMENIYLLSDNKVKLSEFGLYRFFDQEDTKILSGVGLNKRYSAVEYL